MAQQEMTAGMVRARAANSVVDDEARIYRLARMLGRAVPGSTRFLNLEADLRRAKTDLAGHRVSLAEAEAAEASQ